MTRSRIDTLGEPTRWEPSAAIHSSPGVAEGLDSGGRVLPGDANGDGKPQIADSVRLPLVLFGGRQEGPCGMGIDEIGNRRVFDWDGNQQVNLTDARAGLRYLFQEGLPQAAGSVCRLFDGCRRACD